jgi:hypothetical protein
MLATMFPDL